MFNENENKNEMFKKEKQEVKQSNSKDLYDFSDFTHDQNDIPIDNKKTSKDDASFQEFEKIFVTEEEAKEKEKVKSPLEKYFEKSRAAQKQLKIDKKTKKEPKTRKPKKLRGRKKQKEIEDFDDIKKRRVFKYKRKKFTKVEDFIEFLNENFIDLDEIALNILNDENFHGWLKKRSKRFDQSIADFRDIVEIIGN